MVRSRIFTKKTDVFGAFKTYKAQAEILTWKRIKYIQSDNGTEYLTKDFEDFLDQHVIRRRLTVPHSPEQIGIAERKNRT